MKLAAPYETSPWRIAVGLGSCGIASGAQALYDQLAERVDPQQVRLEKTGCIGMCHREPMLELYSPAGSASPMCIWMPQPWT